MTQRLIRFARAVALIGIIGATIGFAGWQFERLTHRSGALEPPAQPPTQPPRVYRGRLTGMQDGYRYAVRFPLYGRSSRSREQILVEDNGSFDFGLLKPHGAPLDCGVVVGPPTADGGFPPVVWMNLFGDWRRRPEDPFPDIHRLPAHELVSISVRGAQETAISVLSRWDHQTHDGPEAQFVLRDAHVQVIAQSSTGAIATQDAEIVESPGHRDATTPREIVLEMPQLPARTVRFEDARGQPLAGVTIQLKEFRGIRISRWFEMLSMKTNALGEATLLWLEPGAYEVRAWNRSNHMFTGRLDLTRTSDVLRLDLTPDPQ